VGIPWHIQDGGGVKKKKPKGEKNKNECKLPDKDKTKTWALDTVESVLRWNRKSRLPPVALWKNALAGPTAQQGAERSEGTGKIYLRQGRRKIGGRQVAQQQLPTNWHQAWRRQKKRKHKNPFLDQSSKDYEASKEEWELQQPSRVSDSREIYIRGKSQFWQWVMPHGETSGGIVWPK